MKKIKMTITIISNGNKIKENLIGTINEGIISYSEDNNTYVYLDIERNALIRENDDLYLKYTFDENDKTLGNVLIKEFNKEVTVDIKTECIEKSNNRYYVEYLIEKDKFIYEITFREE